VLFKSRRQKSEDRRQEKMFFTTKIAKFTKKIMYIFIVRGKIIWPQRTQRSRRKKEAGFG